MRVYPLPIAARLAYRPPPPAPGRLVGIQYLRGVAATVVVVAHAAMHPLPQGTYPTWLAGAFGVTLFFVISGYLMVHVTGEGPFDPRDFLERRIVRIVPLYWTVTLAVALLAILVPAAFKRTAFDGEHLLASLFFVPMRRPSNPEVIEPLVKLGWTLNYEMFFYGLFACAAFQRGRMRAIFLVALLLALVALGKLVNFAETAPYFYTREVLLGFAGGVIVGALHLGEGLEPIGPRARLALLLLASACAVYMVLFAWGRTGGLDTQLALTTLSAALLIWVVTLERDGRLAASRVLSFLGDASYSIYLVHMFAVGLVAAVGKALFPAMGATPYLATALAGFAAGLAFGAVVHLFVEAPLTAFFRRLQRRRRAAACAEP